MKKLRELLLFAFMTTCFGPFIVAVLFAILLSNDFLDAGLLVGGISFIVASILLPLLPFTFRSAMFWGAGNDTLQILGEEFWIYLICTIVLLLPLIGVALIRIKPHIYRVFVYLPLIASLIWNIYSLPLDIHIANIAFIVDIIYLIVAILLDVMATIQRKHT